MSRAGPPPRIAVVHQSFLPYHHDRLAALEDGAVGVALAGLSGVYADFQRREEALHRSTAAPQTLFPGAVYEDLPLRTRLWRVPGALRRLRARAYFLCNYERAEIFLSALLLRLSGRRVYLMFCSRLEDAPRRWWRELGKVLLMAPYHGAVCGGPQSAAYLRLLGFHRRPIADRGYNSVGLDRVRAQAAAHPAPVSGAFLFVGRLVAKKQPLFLIEAYARYAAACAGAPRRLRIIGDGPLRQACADRIAALGLGTVDLLGALPSAAVAGEMAAARALLVPSQYEQWALVVNEALAVARPVVGASSLGAAPVLIENLVSGFVLEPGAAEGWTAAMAALDQDEALWKRMSAAAARLAPRADAARFAEAVHRLADDR